MTINDIDNPTENELLTVQEYFINNASQLVVIDDINTASIQNIDSNSDDGDDSAIAPLATTTKNELIANTAGELGIVLNTREIELIAQNVNYSSDDLQESLEEIKSAIIAFVRHKIALNS
ncbi:MAG: hypothetical protein ACKPDM_34810, partial [Dolichospermum sp.]